MGKKRSPLPSFETIFIFVFFGAFTLMMVPRCMDTKSKLQDKTDETLAKIDSLDRVMDSILVKPKAVNTTVDTSKKIDAAAVMGAKAKKEGAQVFDPDNMPGKLYITINNLKLRRGPHLDSTVLAALPLHETVFFLDEVTEFTQQISLGYEIADEPWVKVRTKKGLDGWVYGAGVHYYKKKREGVME